MAPDWQPQKCIKDYGDFSKRQNHDTGRPPRTRSSHVTQGWILKEKVEPLDSVFITS